MFEMTNFLQAYRYMVGKSEVPTQFHLWCGLSLIASCVADRVWIEKFRGSKLAPNLYVVLLGPSGCGKGVAIDCAISLVKDISLVNLYRGKSTAQFVIDHLGKKKRMPNGRRILENPKLYLVTPELAMSVGSGQFADDLIKLMTELYTGGDYTFKDGTRTRGLVEITGHCVNWLAGTTDKWLLRALTRDAIEGGAMARMVLVPAKYDYELRIPAPVMPPNYDAVRAYLGDRVRAFCELHGPFTKSIEAREIEEQWYLDREKPNDEMLAPTWRRQHDLMLKLAMLYSLADGSDLVIRQRHMVAAKRLSYTAAAAVPHVVMLASMPYEDAGLVFVRDFIRSSHRIQRQRLAGRCSKRGIPARKLDEFIRTLKIEGLIQQVRGARNSTWYEWRERRLLEGIEAYEGAHDNGDEEEGS